MANSQSDDDLFNRLTSLGEENKILLSNEVEFNILTSVECQFNIGEIFSHITTNLGFECNNLSKHFLKDMGGKEFTTTYLSLVLKTYHFYNCAIAKKWYQLGDKNYLSIYLVNYIEGPNVNNERCLT